MTLNMVSQKGIRQVLPICFSALILCSLKLLLLSFPLSCSDSSLEIFHNASSLDLSMRGCFLFYCQLAVWLFFICMFLGWVLSCASFLYLRLCFTQGPKLKLVKEKLTAKIRWNNNLLGFLASSWILWFRFSYFKSYANLPF
jgi:hypothetical protein